jgi:hypothetical protein
VESERRVRGGADIESPNRPATSWQVDQRSLSGGASVTELLQKILGQIYQYVAQQTGGRRLWLWHRQQSGRLATPQIVSELE